MKKSTVLVGTILLSAIFDASAQSQCLVAHYPLNGTVNDTSGNNLHGVNNGAVLTADRLGNANKAYDFNGSSAEMILNNNQPVITTTEFTISAWARIDGAPGGESGQGTIFSQRDDNASTSASSTILLMADDNNNLTTFLVRSSVNNAGSSNAITVPSPTDEAWHHYVASLGADDSLRLFIDGAEVGKTLFTQTGNFVTSIDHVTIGSHRHTGSAMKGAFNGAIDDVKIFNCALRPEQIDTVFTATKEIAMGENKVSIYPNPFHEFTVIEFNNELQESHTLTLYDEQGRLVQSISGLTGDRATISRSSLANGLYFFVLSSGNEPRSKGRLVIQ